MVELLTDDAWLTMPPYPHAYRGPEAIAAFLHAIPIVRNGFPVRLLPIRANTQPAFASYSIRPEAPEFRASGMMVLTLSGERIAAITHFPVAGVFPGFGLTAELPRTRR